MKRPDTAEYSITPLKRRDCEPTFDEAWQAQVLGMADVFVANGLFSADAWAEALGASLERRSAASEPDDAELYYGAVLEALEALLVQSGRVSSTDLEATEEIWRKAYLNTPHGQPVELSAGRRDTSF